MADFPADASYNIPGIAIRQTTVYKPTWHSPNQSPVDISLIYYLFAFFLLIFLYQVINFEQKIPE
jgi:hypothetical protein